MTLFYLDTSALAKRYKPEKGSDVVDLVFERMAAGDRVAVPFLAAVGLAGAVTRLCTSRTISERGAADLLARFREEMISQAELLPVNDLILAIAVRLAERHGLRAADAIHLATMTEMARGSAIVGTSFLALVADRALKRAAESEGITVVNPEDDNARESIET
ncbi:MAG: PIN domain-containing protein [Dehalococcoidia bacterium]|nr:PIN domain-containing protein [Dehalococcoidia bacterium]